MIPSERYDSLFRFWAEWDQDRQDKYVQRTTPVDWFLLKRQAQAESGLDPDAISPVGAEGLTQFMHATWSAWARSEFGEPAPPRRHVSPFNPEDSIRAQADMMSWLLTAWKGDTVKALASYNFGIGNVTRLIKEHGAGWQEHLPEETKRYIQRILSVPPGT